MLSFNIFDVLRQMNIFGCMVKIVNSFWGSLQNWSILGVISIILGVFLKVKVQNWKTFWG